MSLVNQMLKDLQARRLSEQKSKKTETSSSLDVSQSDSAPELKDLLQQKMPNHTVETTPESKSEARLEEQAGEAPELTDLLKQKIPERTESLSSESETTTSEAPELKDLLQQKIPEASETSAPITQKSEESKSLEQPPLEPPPDLSETDGNKKRRLILWIVVAIVVVILLFFFFWPTPKTKPTPKPIPKTTPVPKVTAVVKKAEVKISKSVNTIEKKIMQPKKEMVVPPPVFKPAVLQGIYLSHQDKRTQVTMSTNEPVHYQLHVAKNHKQLTVFLSNTTASDKLAIDQHQDPIVQKITTQSAKDGVNIILTLLPQTEVDSLHPLSKDSDQLILTLHNITAEVPKVSEEKSMMANSVKKVEMSQTPEEKLENDYQSALGLITQDRVNDAINQLKSILEKDAHFVAARKTLIVLLLKQRRYSLASLYIEEGLRLTPDAIGLVELKARLQAMRGQYRAALNTLQEFSPSLQEMPDYYAIMAALQRQLGHPLMASHLYAQLLKVQPNQSAWWMGLGLSLETADRPNAALSAYKQAAATGNLSPDLQAFVEAKIQQLGG